MRGSFIRRSMAVAATLAGTLAVTGVASAATFTVNDPSDAALASPVSTSCASTNGGSCTLRAAVQAADNAGGSSQITLPAGVYKLTIPATGADQPANGDLDIDNNAAITIAGAGSGSTTVDANSVDRAFAVQTGAGLSLSGMTIENGTPSANSTGVQKGGAIYSDGALAVTGDVTFTHNTASSSGGAIMTDTAGGSTISLTGATFTDNAADSNGGALYLHQPGVAAITASTFTSNSTDDEDGNAIYDDGGGLTANTSTFHGNDGGEGGIYIESNFPVSVINSTFSANNSAEGGAIYDSHSSTLTLTGDRFTNNAAGDEQGGALYLYSTALNVTTLSHDEFDGNTASDTGGAIYWEGGSLTVTDSTFVNNSGGDDAGVLYADAGQPLSLTNVTMSDNTAVQGGAIDFGGVTQTTLTNDTITANAANGGFGGGLYGTADATLGAGLGISNTIIADNTGGDCGAVLAAGEDTGHNIDSDSSCFGGLAVAGDQPGVDPLVASPADNGGSVLTDALLAGSPAIDAGTNTNCPATDARGVSRPQGSTCDIGAFEAAAAGLSLTKAAPASITVGNPYNYTLTVTAQGPAAATNTTVTDQLPAGMTLYGSTASQGSCTASGSPAKLTCNLGNLEPQTSATVALVVADTTTGSVTNTATVTDDQGASVNASATTQVNPVSSGTTVTPPPSATTPTTSAPSASAPTAGTVTLSSALLSGVVRTGGQSTSYFFQYGTTTAYGQSTPVQTTSTSKTASVSVTGLTPGTLYHYRLAAINSSGVAYSVDATFRTAGRRSAKVGLYNKHHSTSTLPLRYTLAGRLRLPSGMTTSAGCTGTVTITIKSGTGQLASHRAKVNRGCRYSSSFTLTKRPGKATHGTLKAIARYTGSSLLRRGHSRTVTLHYS
jgi:uncharacterized repeat protein (TIGR01451 family)